MDNQLKAQLRSIGLLPLDIDKEMQEYYHSQGIDHEKLETYFTPGMPEYLINKYIGIMDKVRDLHELEIQDQANTPNYQTLMNLIKNDLHMLTSPLYTLDRMKAFSGNTKIGPRGILRIFGEPSYSEQNSGVAGKTESSLLYNPNSGENAGHIIIDLYNNLPNNIKFN